MKLIIVAIGIIILLLYSLPLIKAKLDFGNIFGIALGIYLVIIGIFHNNIEKLLITNNVFKLCYAIVQGLITIFFLLFFITLAKIVINSKGKYTNEKTLIVLGCRVKGYIPTKALLKRCESAIYYLNNNEEAVIVLSGGQGADENISEAECMKSILIDIGIDESRIFIENKSTSTYENLLYSLEIIKNNDLSTNIAIVSSEYHLYRASLIAKRIGINAGTIPAKTIRFLRIPAFTREVFAIWYFKIKSKRK